MKDAFKIVTKTNFKHTTYNDDSFMVQSEKFPCSDFVLSKFVLFVGIFFLSQQDVVDDCIWILRYIKIKTFSKQFFKDIFVFLFLKYGNCYSCDTYSNFSNFISNFYFVFH